MRTPLDLLELPFALAQLRPMMAEKFVSEARDRGISLDPADLDALHRARVLEPLLEVRKDIRAISRTARTDRRSAEHAARWHPTSRFDLERARTEGRLRDPAVTRHVSPRRRRRAIGEFNFESPVYLYSAHHLIALPLLSRLRSGIHQRLVDGRVEANLVAPRWQLENAREEGRRLRELIIALSVLDPVFYPAIIGRISLPAERDFEAFFRWRDRQRLTAPLTWLRVDAEWIKEAGRELLWRANSIDPLRNWIDLVAEIDPERWTQLRGDARLAVDLRVAAEIFLRYYDRLVRGRRARPIPVPPRRMPSAFDGRLKRGSNVDGLLTDYGISPHPRVVMVLEGETELAVMPRVLAKLGLRLRDDVLALQHAAGTGRDLASLVAFAIAPRVSAEPDLPYLHLVRPPTQLYVVFDPEPPVDSDRARERRRQDWLDRILRSMPSDVIDDAAVKERVRGQLDRLVHLRTWNSRGESFEFAHFTDLAIARAIDRLDQRTKKPPVSDLRAIVANLRSQSSGLKNVLGGVPSKVALADELWPTLDRRIDAARRRNTDTRIPIVAVAYEAVRLAHELPRRNLVIDLKAAG